MIVGTSMRFLSFSVCAAGVCGLMGCGGSSRSGGYARDSYAATVSPVPIGGETSYKVTESSTLADPIRTVGGLAATRAESVAVSGTYGARDDFEFSSDKDISSSKEPPPPPAPIPIGGGSTPGPVTANPVKEAGEMLDIEARVTIECEKVLEAAKTLRALVKTHGGQVINDTMSDSSGSSGSALSVRIPSGPHTDAFLDALASLGKIRSRQIVARDIGKEFHDAILVLRNLEAALKRYTEILAKASDVKEILTVEAELSRVRTQIDRVKGDLRWMKDRASRSTVYVTLAQARGAVDDTPTFNPEAKLYPGLRFGYALDNRGSEGKQGYLGASVSIAANRHFSIDLDVFRKTGNGFVTSGVDLFMVTMGGDTYSDFLGGGKRRFLNPYIGFRAGYARFLGNNEMIAGGGIGLELYKAKAIFIDVNTRIYALFASSAGAHVVVQPSIGANFAF